MDRQIRLQLPVRNIVASSAFYAALGAEWEEGYGDISTALLRFADGCSIMLFRHDRSASSALFPRDSGKGHRALPRLRCSDRIEVDRLARIASWAGGRADPRPGQDRDLFYARSFEDPDGHLWQAEWRDAQAAPPLAQMQIA